MAGWDASWELTLPARTTEELLLCLVIKDLIHGSSFDVESAESGVELAVDLVAGDELDEDGYRLLMGAEVEGPEERETVQAFIELLLEETLEEAEALVAERRKIGSLAVSDLVFRTVPEDEERWDLVIPDWLAPDGSEVPFGFRSFVGEEGEPWPTDEHADAHGRVIVVPFEGEAHAYGIPAPAAVEEE